MKMHYTLDEACELLPDRTPDTLRSLIFRGQLPAFKVPLKDGGKRLVWAISPETLDHLNTNKSVSEYELLYEEWLHSMASGLDYRSPLTAKGIEANVYGMKKFWYFLSFVPVVSDPIDYHSFKALRLGVYLYDEPNQFSIGTRKIVKKPSITEFTPENLKLALSRVRVDDENETCHFSMRDQMYKAFRSFHKVLVRHKIRGYIDPYAMKEIKPVRLYEPKQTRMTEAEFELLSRINESLINGRDGDGFNMALSQVILKMLFYTGIRMHELIGLQMDRVDLDNREFTVRGKGRKVRPLGINPDLYEVMIYWIEMRPTTQNTNFLVQSNGLPITKQVVHGRIKRLAKRAGLDIASHTFRRLFATLDHEEGNPHQHTQYKLGHSKFSTTMDIYVDSDRRKIVNSMKKSSQTPKTPISSARVKSFI